MSKFSAADREAAFAAFRLVAAGCSSPKADVDDDDLLDIPSLTRDISGLSNLSVSDAEEEAASEEGAASVRGGRGGQLRHILNEAALARKDLAADLDVWPAAEHLLLPSGGRRIKLKEEVYRRHLVDVARKRLTAGSVVGWLELLLACPTDREADVLHWFAVMKRSDTCTPSHDSVDCASENGWAVGAIAALTAAAGCSAESPLLPSETQSFQTIRRRVELYCNQHYELIPTNALNNQDNLRKSWSEKLAHIIEFLGEGPPIGAADELATLLFCLIRLANDEYILEYSRSNLGRRIAHTIGTLLASSDGNVLHAALANVGDALIELNAAEPRFILSIVSLFGEDRVLHEHRDFVGQVIVWRALRKLVPNTAAFSANCDRGQPIFDLIVAAIDELYESREEWKSNIERVMLVFLLLQSVLTPSSLAIHESGPTTSQLSPATRARLVEITQKLRAFFHGTGIRESVLKSLLCNIRNYVEAFDVGYIG